MVHICGSHTWFVTDIWAHDFIYVVRDTGAGDARTRVAFEVLIYTKFVGHIHGSWLIWMVRDSYIW